MHVGADLEDIGVLSDQVRMRLGEGVRVMMEVLFPDGPSTTT